MRIGLTMCALLCLACPCWAEETQVEAQATKEEKVEIGKVEQRIIEEVNKERARYGLHPLQLSIHLLKTARAHCGWMARNRSMVHTSLPVAENIAMGQSNVSSVMRAWMNSPGHRANILNGSYQYLGVSYTKTENGTPYWCQQFSGGDGPVSTSSGGSYSSGRRHRRG